MHRCYKVIMSMKPLRLLLCLVMTLPLTGSALYGQARSRTALEALGRLSHSFEALAEQVGPAVVQILVTRYAAHQGLVPADENLVSRQRTSGSGVIIDPEGYVVTNAHVVLGARRVRVLLPNSPREVDGRRSILKTKSRAVGAQVINVDRETDLALLKIHEKGLSHLTLANSDEIKQGQVVFAFGSPLGLENTVTMGVVSSVARQLRPEDPMIYIQTDAPINPGNSGGPLVDAAGQVIGINTLIFSQSGGNEGIGFAAPSNIVRSVVEQIRETGRVSRGEIGVYAQTLTPTLQSALGLAQGGGVVLGDVFPGSSAAEAGLERQDIILTMDGKAMENARQFSVNLYSKPVGETVSVEVLRQSERLAVDVVVIKRPDDLERFAELVSPERNLIQQLGILGIEMTREIAAMFPVLRKRSGVVVAARALDAPEWERGLIPGDVIHEINHVSVKTLAGLREALSALEVLDPVAILVERQGKYRFIALEVE